MKLLRLDHILKHEDGNLRSYITKVEEKDSLIIVRLKGSIDSTSIPALETGIEHRIEKYLNKNIILDFNNVTHVDSATLAALIILLDRLQHHHRKLAIINASTQLKNYLTIENLLSIVHIFNSESEALKELI